MGRDGKKYHMGFEDGLKPRILIDIGKIKDFDKMASAMEQAAFGGRTVGQAVSVAEKMFSDPDSFNVLAISGAMTPAGFGLLVCEMIERGYIHAVVSTGALITHGFVENSGRHHFHWNPDIKDTKLYEMGYDRIYTVYELEKSLDEAEAIIYSILDAIKPGSTVYSRQVCELLGRWLVKNSSGRGILKSAVSHGIPVYIHDFTNCELGLDFALYNRRQFACGGKFLSFNPFFDLEHFAELINQQKKIGLFIIGGGGPRNWAQQVCPYIDLICGRMPEGKAPPHLKNIKYSYAVRICPDPVNLGGFSGSTIDEAKSWGKYAEDCFYSEVLADATMVWPFILAATSERLRKKTSFAGFWGIFRNNKIKKNFSLGEQLGTVDRLLEDYQLVR